MKYHELGYWLTESAKWVDHYYSTLSKRPVRPNLSPGDFTKKLSLSPPEKAQSVKAVFEDFKNIVPDAMTHWQHPKFFAYFPANASPASIFAESLSNSMGAQAMLWQTSPAATEMETVVIDWLRQALGLKDGFKGTIQDTATTATFCAVLTMREKALGFSGLKDGLYGSKKLKIYASDNVHSSIEKAVRLSGIGENNLCKIKLDENLSINHNELENKIKKDINDGHVPAGLILSLGGTSIGASDDILPLMSLAKKYSLYTHIDAAWAGSAMLCPEFRYLWEGVDMADSIVFNPHKWLGAQFDCSIQFLKDPTDQINTLGLRPAYLETLDVEEVTNYNEWTIPLGRRFRALKIWFLMRIYGLEQLRDMIRNHIMWAKELENLFESDENFKVITSSPFGLFTFQLLSEGQGSDENTKKLLNLINADGECYLTQTLTSKKFVIRVSVGSFETTREDVLRVHDIANKFRKTIN
ncbi:MAG: pyridoxal-dependent decarboxylase [Paracoccaceae bacterium]|nr:pyridoxal-dependent decarboxylase [Paracoccaceae bacterium]